MALQRWDAFADLRRLDATLNRLWQGFGRDTWFDGAAETAWAVPLDVVADGDDLVVRASLPGVRPDDLNVTIEDGVLAIRAETQAVRAEKEGTYLIRERRAGTFARSVRLPEVVDADKATSTYADGVLTIRFPKLEAKKAKKIAIAAGGAAGAIEGAKA